MEYHIKQREAVDTSKGVQELIVLMSEGNPGALRVLMELVSTGPMGDGVKAILDLDDMNLRGPQIWVAYKDHCQGSLEAFADAIKARDPELVRTVNAEMQRDESFQFEAVTAGGSSKRSFLKRDSQTIEEGRY